MTKVSSFATAASTSTGFGKVHLAKPSRFPGKSVLFCTGRTLDAIPHPASAEVTCGSCVKRAKKEGVEL